MCRCGQTWIFKLGGKSVLLRVCCVRVCCVRVLCVRVVCVWCGERMECLPGYGLVRHFRLVSLFRVVLQEHYDYSRSKITKSKVDERGERVRT